jgi:hypothetical protein
VGVAVVVAVEMEVAVVAVLLLFGINHNKKVLPKYDAELCLYRIWAICLTVFFIFYFLLVQQTHRSYRADTFRIVPILT